MRRCPSKQAEESQSLQDTAGRWCRFPGQHAPAVLFAVRADFFACRFDPEALRGCLYWMLPAHIGVLRFWRKMSISFPQRTSTCPEVNMACANAGWSRSDPAAYAAHQASSKALSARVGRLMMKEPSIMRAAPRLICAWKRASLRKRSRCWKTSVRFPDLSCPCWWCHSRAANSAIGSLGRFGCA
eukprot:scaffold4882_cov70-Phaeocystis_antarctica.AAC.18